MAREKENYRLELEQVLAHFGGKHIISFSEVMAYTGRGYKWVSNHLDIPHDGCTAVQLAQALACIGESKRRRA